MEKKMRQTLIIILAICLISTTAFAADYVLIVGGAAGEKSFYDAFWSATSRFHELLTDEYGYTPEQITFLFEDMGDSEKQGLVDAESKRDQVLAAFDQLTKTLQPSDRFLLFMLGHASRTGRGAPKFNLMGRDITEAEYVTLINSVPAENQILIFGFPYSGRLVPSSVSQDALLSPQAHQMRVIRYRQGSAMFLSMRFPPPTAIQTAMAMSPC